MTVVDCEHYLDGVCQVASEWATRRAPVTPEACKHCLLQKNPKCRNAVTASMAISAYVLSEPKERSPDWLVQETNPYLQNSLPTSGVGTELKKLLHWFRIHDEEKCDCKQKAVIMNIWGPDRCLQEIDTIVNWLEEAAKLRNIIFIRMAAVGLVHLAIYNARQAIDVNSGNGNV